MSGKRILAALVGALVLSALAVPTVNDLKVTAIPPWGLALDYTVEGATATDTNLLLYVTATAGEKSYLARSLIGATNCVNGAHRIYWNMSEDGLASKVSIGWVSVKYEWPRYCVIDLSAGSTAKRYPVSYLWLPEPIGGWTVEYKTSKIVLRRIDGPNGAYYAGIFEVTEAQWDRVMGGASTSTKPKDSLSYHMIRGDVRTYDWPGTDAVAADSFMGRLRQKTGLATLDLPSEEEWAYAARAGVTTSWLCGDSVTGLGDYAWYRDNSGYETHPVGALRANAWGLYDVHGNVWEWCLNRQSDNDFYRVLRGGSYSNDALDCVFSCRNSFNPSVSWFNYGFRLFCRPESK